MKFNVLSGVVLIYFLKMIYSHIDPVKDFTPKFNRKCNHERRSQERHFLSGKYDRKLANTYYTDIQFQNMRIHLDYTYTLPHEEKMIKELIMPPVKRFFENTLSVRRFPGKIRFPKSMSDCQGIPVPKSLLNEGVDSDLLILVSTYKGMKKFFYEQQLNFSNLFSSQDSKKNKDTIVKNSFSDYLENFFKKGQVYSEDNINLKNSTLNNQTHNSNIPPWELNDGPSDVVGWSFMCLQDIYTLRPLAGVMQYVADILPTQRAVEETIWTTLHEITHVLAMDFDLYGDFIDAEFNKLGYEKTIKIKTRLKDLDKLIEERKEFMNDLFKFSNFNSSYNYVDENKPRNLTDLNFSSNLSLNNITLQNISDSKNSSFQLPKNITKSHKNKTKLRSENINTENFIHDALKMSTTFLEKNRKIKNNKSKIQSKKKENYKNAPYSKDNLTTSKEDDINTSQNSSQALSIIQVSTNNSSNYTTTYLNETELFMSILRSLQHPKINLPVVENFYEIKVPSNLNLTTLIRYIDNFLDHTKIFLITPNVLEVGRKHFECSSMDGVELEHFGGTGSAFSHWSKRILNTEYMIADSYGENFISNFTLALLEDSGWYKVDFSKSETLPWGRKRGCEFLQEKCIMKKKKKNSFFTLSLSAGSEKNSKSSNSSYEGVISALSNVYDSNYKEEFCTSFEEEKCSISHTFRAVCTISKFPKSLPKEYQYFDNPNIGGLVSFGDYCPYPIEWFDPISITPVGSCRNGLALRSEIGEKICENCRCFHSSLVKEKFYKKNSEDLKKGKNVKYKHLDETRAACYESRCRIDKRGKPELIIIMDDVEIKCPRGGAILSVDNYNGFIECPKAEKICTGPLDPKGDYTSTSAYNLFSNLSNKLFSILYEFISNVFKKN
jgi:hypothetical protein